MKDLDVSKMATDQIKKVAHQNKNPIIGFIWFPAEVAAKD